MTYGTIEFTGKHWHLTTDPSVRRKLCRLFLAAKVQGQTVTIPHTIQNALDVDWFLFRYPHKMADHTAYILRKITGAAREAEEDACTVLSQNADITQPIGLALPLRHYQLQALELTLLKGGLLLGDDVGLGKSAVAAALVANTLARPAIIVCQTHLQKQWMEELKKFAPGLRTHIVAKMKHYALPAHDVAIISYAKFAAWAGHYPWVAAVYDECQEFRRTDSAKTKAAMDLAPSLSFRLGLSATPIYNYADEIWAVMETIQPGLLGTSEEFCKEWGTFDGRRVVVKEPEALGEWLRQQFVMLRRRRKDVGRELPPACKVVHVVQHRPEVMARLKKEVHQLARTVLEASFTEKGQAARMLDIKLRQATGIAKAPGVADFVAELVENGEKVLLTGWHREVYSVWLEEFRAKGINAVLYTGSESPTQKARAVQAFRGEHPEGKTAEVFIMSLRSGSGLNGLQDVCKTIVHGELDWSPKVHYQAWGRLQRDGQEGPVTEFYLLQEDGSDPIIAGILGIKEAQSIAVMDGAPDPDAMLTTAETTLDTSRVAEMARQWLKTHA